MFDIHYLTHNIIIGRAELFYVPHKRGWVTPGGIVITDKVEAIKYACILHDYMIEQANIKKQKEVK